MSLSSVSKMVPIPTSYLFVYHLFILHLVDSTTAKTTISFYQQPSCEASSPSAGDAFKTDNLVASSGLCLSPPSGTIALEIEELDEGCMSELVNKKPDPFYCVYTLRLPLPQFSRQPQPLHFSPHPLSSHNLPTNHGLPSEQ